jgi:hypothetical protein
MKLLKTLLSKISTFCNANTQSNKNSHLQKVINCRFSGFIRASECSDIYQFCVLYFGLQNGLQDLKFQECKDQGIVASNLNSVREVYCFHGGKLQSLPMECISLPL